MTFVHRYQWRAVYHRAYTCINKVTLYIDELRLSVTNVLDLNILIAGDICGLDLMSK